MVDLTDPAVAFDPDGYFASMPVVNWALRSLMISEPSRPGLLRYAGALLSDSPGGVQRDRASGGRADGADGGNPARRVARRCRSRGDQVGAGRRGNSRGPGRGLSVERPFSRYLANEDLCGPLDADPLADRGLAAVRINYPYQAATLSGFRSSVPNGIDPMPPNIGGFIAADDGGVQELNVAPGGQLDDGAVGPLGPHGLGRQFALVGRTLRPYRKLISGAGDLPARGRPMSIYRREVCPVAQLSPGGSPVSPVSPRRPGVPSTLGIPTTAIAVAASVVVLLVALLAFGVLDLSRFRSNEPSTEGLSPCRPRRR